jgi:Flp pilus assembly protein TadG
MKNLRRWLWNEKGNVLLFTTVLVVPLLIIFGGLAIDLAHLGTVDDQIQKSLDAAALAGAGNLGFNSSAFPAARAAAQTYANLNPLRLGGAGLSPIILNANTANAPNGDIVLGIWSGSSFTPSLDGTQVNSVLCRYQSTMNTTFLRLLGINSLNAAGYSIAVSNPPLTPPPPSEGCLFPIGVGSCPFQGNTSLGCGASITFISSSGQAGAGCLAPPCTNSAAWVSINPGTSPSANYLQTAINTAGSGNCPVSSLQTGNSLETNNGMTQPVMDTVQTQFVQHWNTSGTYQVVDSSNNVTYSGKGWKLFLPVIQTACPAGAISGSHTILGWTEFVMTQVINKGDCAVANHWSGNPWDALGNTTNCTATNQPSNVGSLRAIFGYYNCSLYQATPSTVPVPRTALGTRLRLVQ